MIWGSGLGVMWRARLKRMGMKESKLPWAGEKLSLTPTGAWLEVVGESGTPSYPPVHRSRGSEMVREQPFSQCPFLSRPFPHHNPTPCSQTPSCWLSCGLMGVPLHSDGHEDAGTLDFSSLLRKR